MQKHSSRLLCLVLFTSLTSCTVALHDQRWCGDMGQYGATCFHTLTTDKETMTKEQWDVVRFGMVCSEAQSFADNKAAIEKLCHDTKECVEVVTKVFLDLRSYQESIK